MVLERIKDLFQKPTHQLDLQEAFNLWDILNSKYHVVERLSILQYFAHDNDLKLSMMFYLSELKENIGELKEEVDKYKIMPPEPNREIGPPPCNIEMYTDEFIAGELLLYLQEHLENMLKALRNSFTNDSVRSLLTKMTKKTLTNVTRLTDYMSAKGWIKMCPRYQNTPAGVDEKLTAGEAHHLWDHLCFRYDNLQQTRIFLSFVHDLDLKMVLEKGLKTLTSQAEMLEKELLHFGIPTPKKPSDITVSPHRIDLMEDRHIYRMVLIGLQSAGVIHAQSVKQCTLNARIREIFHKLLLEEIDILGNYIKFGKLKGWTNPAPAYDTKY